MSRWADTQLARDRARDLAEARARVIARIIAATGALLTAAVAEELARKAKCFGPMTVRRLDEHLAESPEAFTAPTPMAPAGLPRLLHAIADAGFGDRITLLDCVSCGEPKRSLRRVTPAGLACDWCSTKTALRTCSRCGNPGLIVTRRRADGSICRSCYRADPEFLVACAACGRRRPRQRRMPDGSILCVSCAPIPIHQCAGCDQLRPAAERSDLGPLCAVCWRNPPRPCGVCSRPGRITVTASAGAPDVCIRCYRLPATCAGCGRIRTGNKHRSDDFYCAACWPRVPRPCDDCSAERPIRVIWPIGQLCATCYTRRSRNPRPCSDCGRINVLVARSTTSSADICGPCAGTSLDFTCSRCNHPGDLLRDSVCARCIVTERVTRLLSTNSGAVPEQLVPLAAALTGTEHPRSVLTWLHYHPSTTLLTSLIAAGTDLTHARLDQKPQDTATRHLRRMLTSTGILNYRDEHLAQLELWTRTELNQLPEPHRRILRPYAEWHLLRRARRNAHRGSGPGHVTYGTVVTARTSITTAAGFIGWLDTHQVDLQHATQSHLDLWVDTHPTKHRGLESFLRWALARRLTSLQLPRRRSAVPTRFHSTADHQAQLHRCLTDSALPSDLRIAGALIRLYATTLTRLIHLTADHFHRDDQHAYLTLHRHPVLLPPTLASLIENHLRTSQPKSLLRHVDQPTTRYLLPGHTPGIPRSQHGLAQRLRAHALPSAAARNTALIEAVTALPATIISDLFGIRPQTAHSWANYAQDSWADYLAADEHEPT